MAKYPGIERGKGLKASDMVAALDSKLSLTGEETIKGQKTFTTSPLVPEKDTAAGKNPRAIATEMQVYNAAYGPLSGLMSLTGYEEINGIKTFTTPPVILQGKDTAVININETNSKALATEAQVYKTLTSW